MEARCGTELKLKSTAKTREIALKVLSRMGSSQAQERPSDGPEEKRTILYMQYRYRSSIDRDLNRCKAQGVRSTPHQVG
eukprot:2110378-Amphidinium_carterae.1